ncbi:MAG: bacillithiol system redox-active protein YtxJ [Flavobacterium sp.]|nr:bacillithiol system redox-active protein YtxJ [Flavobacterium sp.]
MSFFKTIFGDSNDETSSPKMNWRLLTDEQQIEEMVEISNDQVVIIFKHSTRCSVSRMVLKQFEKEFDLEDKIVPYFLDLLEYRALSNAIASRFDVVHQSPQILVIKSGVSVYDASHSDISAAELKNYL